MRRLSSSVLTLAFAQFVALAGHGYLYYGYEAKIFASYQIWLALVNILFPLIVSRNETRLIASKKNIEFLAVAVSWSRNIAAVLILVVPFIALYFFSISITITILAVLQALALALIHFAIHLIILEQSVFKASILRSATILLPPLSVVAFASIYGANELNVLVFHFVTTLALFLFMLVNNKNFRTSFVSGVGLPTIYKHDLLKSGGVAGINSLARQLPLIFINTFQNSNITADFALVQRIYNSPLSIIGTVAADYLKKRYKQGQLVQIKTLFVISTLTINILLFCALLFLMLVADQYIKIERIDNLISLSLVIITPFLIRSVASPLSIILVLNDKFLKDMFFQVILIVATALTFVFVETTQAYINVFAIVTSIFYLIYGVVSFREISVGNND